MRDYGVVRTRFWSWAKRKKLSLRARDVALYLLTSPHGNSLGCFRLPEAYICDDLGEDGKRINEALVELEGVGFLERDEEGWTWVRDFLQHNPIPNGNVGKAVGKMLEQVPQEVPFYLQLLDSCEANKVSGDLIETLRERYRNGFDRVSPVTETHTHTQTHEHTHEQTHTHEHEPPAARLPLDEAVEAYNAEAEKAGWAKVQRLTGARRSALKARLSECGGLSGWQCAMAKAGESRFLTGKVPRGRGHENWRPDFDFFLKPANFTKLMEGTYDDHRNGAANDQSNGRDGIAADFAAAADLLRDKHYDSL
mgnify:FL=1